MEMYVLVGYHDAESESVVFHGSKEQINAELIRAAHDKDFSPYDEDMESRTDRMQLYRVESNPFKLVPVDLIAYSAIQIA